MSNGESSSKQTKKEEEIAINNRAFEEYLKICEQNFVPVVRTKPTWVPTEELLDPEDLDIETFFGKTQNATSYRNLVLKDVEDWSIEKFEITPHCIHSSQLMITGVELPQIRVRCKFDSVRGTANFRTLITDQRERIERRLVKNQFYAAWEALLPYLNEIEYVPQEMTTVSCLRSTFKVAQIVKIPFVTIIITDVVSGNEFLNELEDFEDKKRLRVSFEYVIDDMDKFEIKWISMRYLPTIQLFKGYFPSFTKEVFMNMKQTNFMVMKCDLQPDDMISFVERWKSHDHTAFEGCCIGFNKPVKQVDWTNFRSKFTLKRWDEYPEWATYSQTIQEENWNFNILNTYNLIRKDKVEATLVFSSSFFIMAVTHLPDGEESRSNSNFMRERLGSFCFYPLPTIRLSKFGDSYNRYHPCDLSCDPTDPLPPLVL